MNFTASITVGLKNGMLDPETNTILKALNNQGFHAETFKNESPVTSRFQTGEVIKVPIAHGELTPAVNHSGSYEHITGVFGSTRKMLAMMPHPERVCDELLGSVDSTRIFGSMIDYCESR
jgi:phosphoribosylformylglycinamidine synthase